MTTPTSDPETYRRRQRRRALIGWIGGLGVIAVVVLVIVLAGGGGSHEPRPFKVPYGETMTSAQYAEIHDGEEAADVLEGLLDASGRPERFTKSYVLVLFPPREEGDACTYWEFSDAPQIFARLCFSESSGELMQKLKKSVLHPLLKGEPVRGQAV
jgi:hypothetical protein